MSKSERNPKSEIRYSQKVHQGGFEGSEEEFWGVVNGTNQLHEENQPKRVFDLCERTALFGEAIIRFAKKIPRNAVNNRLIDQLVGAATSIGANHCEAEDAVSKKEFKLRIGTCRKESRETKFWLRMIAAADPDLKTEARFL